MTYSQYVVDAFSKLPFSGNPAAVVPLPQWPSDAWMQDLAAENNLAETVFLVPEPDGAYAIRWFTPTVEVDLCGHATLAAAYALWHFEGVTTPSIRFHSASGPLDVYRDEDLIYLNFPANPVHDKPVDEGYRQQISDALNTAVGRAASDGKRLVAEVKDQLALEHLVPNKERLLALQEKTIIVGSAQDGEWVCRVFAPRAGIDEDPVTGSAYTALVPHWHHKSGEAEFVAHQLSKRRGTVYCRYAGERVHIGGHACAISQATLLIEPFERKLV